MRALIISILLHLVASSFGADSPTDAPPALTITVDRLQVPEPPDPNNPNNPTGAGPASPLLISSELHGFYRGTVAVTESVPDLSFPTSTATIRVAATYLGGVLRIQAPPGTQLLGLLDGGAYASILIYSGVAADGTYSAEARKHNGRFSTSGRKLRLTFSIAGTRHDYATDLTLTTTTTIEVDLVRSNR